MAGPASSHGSGDATLSERLNQFLELRPRLIGLAYRMLGLRGDAEDVVQDAYLRWHEADGDAVRSAEAWLVSTVSRLSIDRLRTRQRAASPYSGPWLPEPWVDLQDAPDHRLDSASSLSIAFMTLLERLSPEERAALLLHDVFEVGYARIALTLGRSEAASRQLVHRARMRLRRDGTPRRPVDEAGWRRLVEQYLAASAARDEVSLLALFAADASYTSDGGGKVRAATRIIRGAARCARLVTGIARKGPQLIDVPMLVNGEWGFVSHEGGRLVGVAALETDGDLILAVRRQMNPDKLARAAADLGIEPVVTTDRADRLPSSPASGDPS